MLIFFSLFLSNLHLARNVEKALQMEKLVCRLKKLLKFSVMFNISYKLEKCPMSSWSELLLKYLLKSYMKHWCEQGRG